jgi:hypothetical protein
MRPASPLELLQSASFQAPGRARRALKSSVSVMAETVANRHV